MLSLLVAVAVAGAPGSRLFIASGAKAKSEAEKLQRALVLPKELRLSSGFPKLIESKGVEGLNPGFFLVVLGACDDVSAAQTSHSNGLAALEKSPDDRKLLFEVAQELDAQGSLLGASILLRRATALGATDQPTLELLRKVEFVLEDAPFRLPL